MTTVLIKNAILSYPSLIAPKENKFGGKPRYEAVALVDRGDTETLDKLRAAVVDAYQAGIERYKWPKLKDMSYAFVTYTKKCSFYDGEAHLHSNHTPTDESIEGIDSYAVVTAYRSTASKQGAPAVYYKVASAAARLTAESDYSKTRAGTIAHFVVDIYPYEQGGIGADLVSVLLTDEEGPLGLLGGSGVNPEALFEEAGLSASIEEQLQGSEFSL